MVNDRNPGRNAQRYRDRQMSQPYWDQGNFYGQRGNWRQEYWRPNFDRSHGSHSGPGEFTGRGPKGYKRSDERIKEDISEQLTQHEQIDATEIEVQVQDRNVTLTGTVNNRQAKRMTEDLVENVSGVQEVINQIRVVRDESNRNGNSQNGQGIAEIKSAHSDVENAIAARHNS
jgi:BON domain